MKKNSRKDQLFLKVAASIAAFSHCNRYKVGAVIVDQDNRIISTGYNGTPKGTCNDCEDKNGKTKPTVIHAERNAIAYSRQNITGCTLYVTLSPCIVCASEIIQCGISRVVFAEKYQTTVKGRCGIEYLLENGVDVSQVPFS